MAGHAEEKVVGKHAAIVEGHRPALRVHQSQFTVGDESDVALRERGEQRLRGFGRRRDRNFEREDERDFAGAADAAIR